MNGPDKVRAAYASARAALAAFLPASEAEREARLLIGHGLGAGSAAVVARLDDPWPDAPSRARFEAGLAARLARQPMSQILGQWEFHGRSFTVTPDTLTPRPETEALVDLALAELALTRPVERMLDLGTGTGAIVVSMLAERHALRAVATDLSDAALAVAATNARRHGVADRLRLQRADWFDGVVGRFDLIVSNPPYVAEAAYATLAPEITRWEPRTALTPGGDGLDAYRAICAGVRGHLASGGRLLVEIGFDQGTAVVELFRAAGLSSVAVHKDLAGHDRIVAATAP